MFSFFRKKQQKLLDIKNTLTPEEICTNHIEPLYSFIETKTGILLDIQKELIRHKILTFCVQNNITSFNILLDELKKNKPFFENFIGTVTINETYFFREKKQIIKALLSHSQTSNEELRILSLPSSRGDEVYTIVLLAFAINLTNFHVVGVDIDKQVIQKAKQGVYNPRALHKIDKETLMKYFEVEGDVYHIKNSVKKFTSFYQYNLFDDELFQLGKFDIIFSRNLFIYFNDSKKIEAYKRLEKLKKNHHSQIYLGHADISSKLHDYIRRHK